MSRRSTDVATYQRPSDGVVVGAHNRRIADRQTDELDAEVGDRAAAIEAFGASLADTTTANVDSAVAESAAGAVLADELLPEVVGQLRKDGEGLHRPTDGFDYQKLEQLAVAAGVPDEDVGRLKGCLDEFGEAASLYDRVRHHATNHEDEAIRQACGFYADDLHNATGGELTGRSDALDTAWRRFQLELTQRAAPRMIELGLVLGPDQNDKWQLATTATEAYEKLIG